MGLNHPVPSSFHIRAGQLDHSWVSRFYNTQLAQESSQLFLSHRREQLEDSLYPILGQPPRPVCNLNSHVSDFCLDHLCLSTGDFISPFCQKVQNLNCMLLGIFLIWRADQYVIYILLYFPIRSQVQIQAILGKGLSKQVGAVSEPLR